MMDCVESKQREQRGDLLAEFLAEMDARAPSQARSRARYDRILKAAGELLTEQGGDGFTMSDLVERAEVPFGSLYQYFPDKTAVIGALALRVNEVGRQCVRQVLEEVQTAEQFTQAMHAVTDGYVDAFREEPMLQPVWAATQTDPVLRALDEADCDVLANYVVDAVLRIDPDLGREKAQPCCRLMIRLLATAVRYAITLDPQEAEHVLEGFKRQLPPDLPALIRGSA